MHGPCQGPVISQTPTEPCFGIAAIAGSTLGFFQIGEHAFFVPPINAQLIKARRAAIRPGLEPKKGGCPIAASCPFQGRFNDVPVTSALPCALDAPAS